MPQNNFCELHLEESTLEWFEELDYEMVFAPYIAPDGEYPEMEVYNDLILNDRLKDTLERINPKLPNEAI